jgi:hypothetical protein
LQRWLERCQVNQMMEKEKIMKKIIIIPMAFAAAVARAIMAEEDVEDAKEADEVVVEEAATNDVHLT